MIRPLLCSSPQFLQSSATFFSALVGYVPAAQVAQTVNNSPGISLLKLVRDAYKLAKCQAIQCLDSTAQLVRHCQDEDILSAPTQEQLHCYITNLNECYTHLEQRTCDLQKVQEDDDGDSTNAEAIAILSKLGAASNAGLEIFDIATQQHGKATPVTPPDGHSSNKTAQFRANKSLKPKELSMGFSPAQFRNWKAQFRAYCNSSKMTELSLPEQQAYLFHNIGDTIHDRIMAHINDQTPILGGSGCMQLIQDEFLRAHLLIHRIIAFVKCKEENNQDLADCIAKLNGLGSEADLHNLTMDDLFMLQLMVGIKDMRITKKWIIKGRTNTKRNAYRSWRN